MKRSQLRARYWRIVAFFARVTGSFIYWEIVLPRIGFDGWSRRTRSSRYRNTAIRFRALAIRMGGLMIKVGQFLSARLDVLPPEITQELSGLQDEVPAEDFAGIRELAEAELGCQLSDCFEWVDETPMAAASLGQVHRAKLCQPEAEEHGFENVVFKVQRPHIEQIVDVDLAALRRVGGWLQNYKPVAKRANVNALVEEFAATTLAEIDYLAEGSNAETFDANFRDDPRVHVPCVVWSLTTRRVLTLEDVFAIKITDYDAITAAGVDRAYVAAVLLDVYLQQIFEDGFFHADPHPGNLFITPEPERAPGGEGAPGEAAGAGAGTPADETATAPAAPHPRDWKLTFVDFGMVGHVPENLRIGLREALVAIGTQNAGRLVQSFKTLDVLLPSADLALIERASSQVFERFWGMSMSDLRKVEHSDMMQFGLQFQELMLEMPFQLPENLLLLGRTVAILSGMCTGMDPDFNLWTSLAPYASRLIAEEGESQWDVFLAEATKIFQTLIALPGRTDRVLGMAERGELNVKTPLLDLRVRRLERAVTRQTGAIVFAALLVAGAVLHQSDAVLGNWLMVASAVVLVWLFFSGRGRRPGR